MQNKVFKWLMVILVCNILFVNHSFAFSPKSKNITSVKFKNVKKNAKTLDLYVLNVGQGNCVLVKFPNDDFMLVDCGSTSGGQSDQSLFQEITSITGGKDIKTVVVTHPDEDHYNKIEHISEAQNPKEVLISFDQNDYQNLLTWFNKVSPTTNSQKITIFTSNTFYSGTKPINNKKLQNYLTSDSTISINILAVNEGNNKSDTNQKSIVLQIIYKKNSIILTGDATTVTENKIIQNWPTPPLSTDLLLVGHHGSHGSSSKLWLEYFVKPKIGVISASANHNGYHHPTCDVIDLLENCEDINSSKCLAEDKMNSYTVSKHRLDCYDSNKRSPWQSVWFTDAMFSTADSGDILYSTDGQGSFILYTEH